MQTIEITDLTFAQVKELAGLNGHAPNPVASSRRGRVPGSATAVLSSGPNIHGFIADLTDRARLFIAALRDHPDGVDLDAMATLLELSDAKQIGGFTGGGLSKFAKKHHIDMKDIYKTEVKFPDGKRTLMFYPGKLVKNGLL